MRGPQAFRPHSLSWALRETAHLDWSSCHLPEAMIEAGAVRLGTARSGSQSWEVAQRLHEGLKKYVSRCSRSCSVVRGDAELGASALAAHNSHLVGKVGSDNWSDWSD